MTHPDALTIPRAVVEQALEALENTYSGSIQGYHEAFDNLSAALQPQAAAWQTLSQQIQEAAIASGQKQRTRENNQGIASDAWLHPIGTCSPERDGENQHHEHRAGESDAKCADCECDSECTRVSGGGQVRAEQIAQAAAEPVAWMLRHHDVNDGKWYVIEKERYEAAEGVPGFERRELYATPPATQAEPVIPAGFALVPIRATAAMEEAFSEEGWEWANVLAAAEAVTEDEYEAALEGTPPATQAAEPVKDADELCFDDSEHLAAQAASDCRTCQHLSEAWGVCEARPTCVGGEQYVYFPEKQLWDKTPRNDGQAAHQEMREALYAEFNRAVGRQHD